ncbi:MAG: class I SAM-dependent methyltransferase [Acidimicrobiia bacterium]
MSGTDDPSYADRLAAIERAWWKRYVPNPYRWNVRRMKLGRVLEPGCGIGRNLGYLDGNGVGVDHNESAVAECRRRGFTAYAVDEFFASRDAVLSSFDSLLCAHLVEHLTAEEAVALVAQYRPFIRPGGRVVFITPQEKGQASDPTHVRLCDFDVLAGLCADTGLRVTKRSSFPLPRFAGRWFVYNEFVVVSDVNREVAI